MPILSYFKYILSYRLIYLINYKTTLEIKDF
ncbi:hypothetical protein SAMN05216436_10768 [bacterium A37T11]|nr:hypothetical protein SAMN05216436_10768 [bacterium A37T11]